MEENLKARQAMLTRAASDREYQQTVWDACSRDILYFVNLFCWTYDPRKPNPKIPFITYPFQDNALQCLAEALPSRESRGHDVIIEKSRDMGASWMCLTLFFWKWTFHPLQSFLMVSRKESLVDGSADSLFGHIDFLMKGVPKWMRPNCIRNKLKLINTDNGSKIEGESTNDNIGRGGRRTSMLIDEFAAFEGGGWETLSATADTTNCRLFNSTPCGTGNAFYAQRQKGTPRLRLHWPDHPEKGEGQWTDDEGKLRSPWYDAEVVRRAHPVEIATQLDIDYQGSAYPFFPPETLRELRRDFCREPDHVGTVYVQPGFEPLFEENDKGNLLLWCLLDSSGNPPSDRDYVVGCDISQGTGASDSAVCVGDRLSGEKVAELCTNEMSANKFAELVVAICRMFRGPGGRGAFLIWEATGPGRTFGKTVVDDCGFSNIYYMTDERSVRKKQSDRPGWFSTGDGKKDLLNDYRNSLVTKSFINPSGRSLNQAGEFIYLPNGKIEHSGSVNSIDPTDRGDNHGDVVIADALCSKVLVKAMQTPEKEKQGPPLMSLAWRREQRETYIEDW